MLEHGGKLRQAARRYGIALEDWVDLSTGINPEGWPVPAVPASAWARLPEEEDGLVAAAKSYYNAPALLPVAGSQAAIQMLPRLRRPAHVAMLSPTYAEHEHAWRLAGHSVQPLGPDELAQGAEEADVVVLVNPNNPTGHCFSLDQLLDWHQRLAARDGWLVVDEAFMDVTPDQSLAPHCHRPGLVVLRSLGKFFGLAGARVGFVLAWAELLEQLRERLGPWAVAGPSRHIAQAALTDRGWQGHMRQQLPQQAGRLAELLSRHGLPPSGGTALFQTVETAAEACHQRLARRGIFTRLFSAQSRLRFGLPADEAQWRRLEAALGEG